MRMAKSIGVRLLTALSSMLVCGLFFLATYPAFGIYAALANALPAAAFGLLFGVRGGILYAFVAFPSNALLFYLVHTTDTTVIHVLGLITWTWVSVVIGWARDVTGLNRRFRLQTAELEAERKQLQEEIARRTLAEEKSAHEALHDPLTDLPNRRLFFARIEHAYAWSQRNPDQLCAVLYLDLNKFKTVNDSLGHEAGDELLRQVARRLQAAVREVDTVARMGGDEFAILLEAAPAADDVLEIAQRIQASLELPYDVQGRAVVSGASIGVVLSIAAYQDLDGIWRDADAAMYQAKALGGNHIEVFNIAQKV
jgi:diguanylate cyclase (GGDEF)-like protein